MSKAEGFRKPQYYDNRELSWLKFEQRVLNEAKDKNIPILDRLKFVSITSSNLDEFFMVRVASLKDMEHANYTKKDIAGMNPSQQLEAIGKEVHALVEKQYNTYNRSLMPLLKKKGIQIVGAYEELNEKQRAYVDKYFIEHIYPVLTPMAVDASRPFPLVRNKSLNIAALIKSKNPDSKLQQGSKQELEFATVQVPSVLPRLVQIPGDNKRYTFILLEQIIEKNMAQLFLHYDVVCAYPYRIMRNADLSFDEDEASDLLKEIQKQLVKRQWGEVIRLEIEHKADERLLGILEENLEVSTKDVYEIAGPLDLTFLMKMYGLEGCDDLREKPFVPQRNPRIAAGENIFDEIKKGDIFLTHPYETFDPVVDFIKQAAVDPDVLAIKQTLYRVSGNSPIIAALAKAAENGKQVTVLVELKARFDEENNIEWSRRLEEAGCKIIYGIDHIKVHSKLCLITYKDGEEFKYITHVGTGNFNEKTAKLYTDLSLITSNTDIARETADVFNNLGLGDVVEHTEHLLVAPKCLQNKIISLIEAEIDKAKNGDEAYIGVKINSLTDKTIIEKLVEASMSGVKVDMIIRGISCMRAGIEGYTDNITITSIVGRFLEHSRIYIFGKGNDTKIYISSADFMTRNTIRRVEVAAPVYDEEIKERLLRMFNTMLSDNVKARVMASDGNYYRKDVNDKETRINSQEYFYDEAIKKAQQNIIK